MTTSPLALAIGLVIAALLLAVRGNPTAEPDPQIAIDRQFAFSNDAIADALRQHMASALAIRKNLPPLDVQVSIQFTPTADGMHRVEIAWAVYETTGRKVGTVSQDNVITQWVDADHRTWHSAASAAAVGVYRLFFKDYET